ncbi:Calcium-dependent secretion activator 1 [Dissostichus eleginoides]|uniref:Calcium-dependent secretion activator 1 n=1 Tax=Dissostichus eleginoides TaxID=100907 RepID=A0AAD9F794_DISEL|nr:Calcium-dependent secretion activator 1 [Dissostichus eleginoides]
MLDPSSSEDTGGESDPEVVQEAPRKQAPSSGGKRGNNRRNPPHLELLSPGKIYVFVLRCIAYPFNAKQPTDMARRQQKFLLAAVPLEAEVMMQPVLSGGPRSDSMMLSPQALTPQNTL